MMIDLVSNSLLMAGVAAVSAIAGAVTARRRRGPHAAATTLLDPLTDLPNRMLSHDRLSQSLKRARRSGTRLATFLVDLDGFKTLNDSLGNQHGDALLRKVAARLRGAVRAADTLGRFGNDVFIVVAADVADGSVPIIAERLLSAFAQPYVAAGKQLTLTASIGVAVYPHCGDEVNALLRNADTALAHCKGKNRGRYTTFEPAMNEATIERQEMENHLRAALQNRELNLHYQPICDATGLVVGVEALARWKHRGVPIAPSRFIPIAEESGLIVPIGTWILGEACRWARAWQTAGRRPLRVSVNVSALQFAQDDFVQTVRQSLTAAQLDPACLEIELTETLLMRNAADVSAKLQELRRMGVLVAIDDFGTGYSSLAYLQKLPIDILKIDRSFIKDIPSADDLRGEKTAVIRAILSMAHSLSLQVIAEGVETQTHVDFLKRVGCHQMQGYYYSPAKPAREIVAVIAQLDQRSEMQIAA